VQIVDNLCLLAGVLGAAAPGFFRLAEGVAVRLLQRPPDSAPQICRVTRFDKLATVRLRALKVAFRGFAAFHP
jgi:hypothetical protein